MHLPPAAQGSSLLGKPSAKAKRPQPQQRPAPVGLAGQAELPLIPERSPVPRQLAVSWDSNPGIPTPTDSHLQLQQRPLCQAWVSPGGHVSLPGLGEEARVVCGMESVSFLLSRLPNPTARGDGWAALALDLAQGILQESGLAHQAS